MIARHASYFDRDMARGRAAAQRCRAAGGTEVDAIMAQFDATFGPEARHSTFKARVSDMMKRGARDAETRYYFGGLAEEYIDTPLEMAIVVVERMRAAEINARDVAVRTWGRCSRPQTRLLLLNELRLILRWLARYAPERFETLLDAVRED
jgi:hypothetical protein